MLKQTILSAVAKAKVAIQDLAVEVSHVKRGAAVHVPGSTPTYPETVTAVSVVFTRYSSKEIDGDRIQASDWRGLVFPETGLPNFNANDLLRIPPSMHDLMTGDYRILMDDRIMAGDTVALHQLQLRKL